MSDGTGGIGEAVKGVIGGTINEIAEAGKVAVGQIANTQSNSSSPQQYGHAANAYKANDEQKKAQIRSNLHSEMIRVTPKPSTTPNQQESNGPIAAQNFQNSNQGQRMQQLGTSKPKGPNIAVRDAINPGERGKQNKG